MADILFRDPWNGSLISCMSMSGSLVSFGSL